MIVGNQLTPFTSHYSKMSCDNFVVYLFYLRTVIISTGQLKA